MGPANASPLAASAYSRAASPRMSATRGWSGAKRKSRNDGVDTGAPGFDGRCRFFGTCGRESRRPARGDGERGGGLHRGVAAPGHVLVGTDQHGGGTPQLGQGGSVLGRPDGGDGHRDAVPGTGGQDRPENSARVQPAQRSGIGQQSEARTKGAVQGTGICQPGVRQQGPRSSGRNVADGVLVGEG